MYKEYIKWVNSSIYIDIFFQKEGKSYHLNWHQI